jgi:hypothetical protein
MFHNTLTLFIFQVGDVEQSKPPQAHIKKSGIVTPKLRKKTTSKNRAEFPHCSTHKIQPLTSIIQHSCAFLMFHNTLPLFMFRSASPSPFRQGLALRKNEEGRVLWKKQTPQAHINKSGIVNTQDPATDLDHTASCALFSFSITHTPSSFFPSASPSPFRQRLALRKHEEGEGVVEKSKPPKHTSKNRAS